MSFTRLSVRHSVTLNIPACNSLKAIQGIARCWVFMNVNEHPHFYTPFSATASEGRNINFGELDHFLKWADAGAWSSHLIWRHVLKITFEIANLLSARPVLSSSRVTMCKASANSLLRTLTCSLCCSRRQRSSSRPGFRASTAIATSHISVSMSDKHLCTIDPSVVGLMIFFLHRLVLQNQLL